MKVFADYFQNYLIDLWDRSKDFSRLRFLEKLFFYFLCLIEQLYKFFFFIVCSIKKFLGEHKPKKFKIISVGNLSVGGTGKSVFVQFLLKNIKSYNGAVFIRGYGRKSSESILVDEKNCKRFSAKEIGDEAKMFCEKFSHPIIVGRDRLASLKKLQEFSRERKEKINFVVLDDAYQNHSLKKNFEVLLLDSKNPFGNNHCLPAGPLREKDFSRADAIIFTRHKTGGLPKIDFCLNKIFSGNHEIVGVRQASKKIFLLREELKNKKFLCVAGIGMFSGFKNSVQSFFGNKNFFFRFPDHHDYSEKDLEKILKESEKNNCDGVLTTEKDWQKLRPLAKTNLNKFFILEVEFKFSSEHEHDSFFELLYKKTF